jgi:DNA-binding NarL/FixJ family response regulator
MIRHEPGSDVAAVRMFRSHGPEAGSQPRGVARKRMDRPDELSRTPGRQPGVASTILLPMPPLTARETEVLRLVSGGLANKEIARSLNRSERTVKAHLTAIFSKLGVDNRTQAAALAIEKQLV